MDPSAHSSTIEQESEASQLLWKRLKASLSVQSRVLRKHPAIGVVPLLLFAALCTAGLVTIYTAEASDNETKRQEAQGLAEKMSQFFVEQLDRAFLPVFSLAQFVSELDMFRELPAKIGPAFQDGSLPFSSPTHRNVTGVCDEPALVQHFNDIASTIKQNAKMEGVLVSLQLAPEAVVCLVYPVVNTEDFENGIVMDNTGAIGHDLLTDPARKANAEAALRSDQMVLAGPLTLRQCDNCDPTVEKAVIARLPIATDNHTIEVNGEVYNRWGLAMGLINWNALIERSNVYDTFLEQDMVFQLTKTEQAFNASTGGYAEQVAVLAETPGFFDGHYVYTVTTVLESTTNTWEMTVGYNASSSWGRWAIFATVFISFCIAALVYVVLLQKQLHNDMAAEKSALLVENARNAAIAERELNEFIAHEVRNPLSAAMSACAFVSVAVHEAEPLVTEESKKSVREDVDIIDQSLRFINDLLRSMLDVQRAAHKQMTFDITAVSILHDVFEPVAAMLYRRDEAFRVLVDCPQSLAVRWDRLRLQQIILNLSRNSAKFVEKGFIRLRADVENDDSVCLYVEDSGPGIPEQKRKNLFCRFQKSLDSLNQGTGVGLNLCKNLVDLMDGELRLDETYDSGVEGCPGTRIIVNLKIPPEPIYSDHLDATDDENDVEQGIPLSIEEEQSHNFAPPPGNLSVLFVDDDRVLRKLAVRSINRFAPNWKLREASSGEISLQLVETEKFDVIFMDQYMTSAEHGLKGTETVRALRAKGVSSILVGLSANDLEGAFLKAGADSFVMKPFPCKENELLDLFSRILRQHPPLL